MRINFLIHSVMLLLVPLSACPGGTGGPNIPPGQCFATPGAIGCCGPLATAANEIGGIATYGCANGRQQVYQARFYCGGESACKDGQHTAVINGSPRVPSSCSGDFALFAVDDESCPTTW